MSLLQKNEIMPVAYSHLQDRHRTLQSRWSLGLVYAAAAVSGILPLEWWSKGSVSVIPLGLLLVAIALSYRDIRRSPIFLYDGRIQAFLLYVVGLAVIGLVVSPFLLWSIDMNGVIFFFGTFYLFAAYWNRPETITRFVFFFWAVHLIGGVILVIQVTQSGFALSDFFMTGYRLGVAPNVGLLNVWKIHFSALLVPFALWKGMNTNKGWLRLAIIAGALLSLGLSFLTLTRTYVVAAAISLAITWFLASYGVRFLGARGTVSLRSKLRFRDIAVLTWFGVLFLSASMLLSPRIFEETTQIVSSGIASLIDNTYGTGTRSISAYSPDTIDLRIRESLFLVNDLSPTELILGRMIGGSFNPSSIYGIELGTVQWAEQGAVSSHNNYLTLVLKGGMVMVFAVLLVFPRYFLFSLKFASAEDSEVYVSAIAVWSCYLVAMITAGALHNLTGAMPLGALLALLAGLRYHLKVREISAAQVSQNA